MAILGWWCGVLLAAAGCRQLPPSAPPDPPPHEQLVLGEPVARPRQGAPGAPVECNVEARNQSGRTLVSATVRCELLDERGWPISSGLGALQNVPAGQSRQVRTVVYGVRSFSRARAVVTATTFQ